LIIRSGKGNCTGQLSLLQIDCGTGNVNLGFNGVTSWGATRMPPGLVTLVSHGVEKRTIVQIAPAHLRQSESHAP